MNPERSIIDYLLLTIGTYLEAKTEGKLAVKDLDRATLDKIYELSLDLAILIDDTNLGDESY